MSDTPDYTIRVGPEEFTYYQGFPPTLQGASNGGDVGPGSTIMFTLYNRTDTVTINLDSSAFTPSSLELSASTPSGTVTVTETQGSDYWFSCDTDTNEKLSGLPKLPSPPPKPPPDPSPGTMGGSVDVIIKW